MANRSRTFRIEDEIYEAARVRAEREGVTVSAAIARLVQGYAQGLIPLPVVRTELIWPKKEKEA